jgi:flavorubredoxin
MSRLVPVSIAPDTYVVRRLRTVHGSSLWVSDNFLVITGAEPAIVASGIIDSSWREGAFAVVEPADVRWIYLCSDHLDPRGLAEVMLACPRARLVASRAALRHHAADSTFGLERCREIADGASVTIGDHRLLSVRAPLWSVPGARNLLDQRTGVYWAATTFGCLLPNEPPDTVAELDIDRWVDGMAMFAHYLLAPWLDLVDHGRFAARCDRTQALGMTTIASAHSPLITDASIDDAFRLLRALPATPAPPWPGPHAL